MADLLFLMGFVDEPAVGKIENVSYDTDHHLTIIPFFEIDDWALESLRNEFKEIASHIEPLNLVIGDNDMFGPQKNIPVTRVSNKNSAPYSLTEIHETFYLSLLRHGGDSRQAAFCGKSYSPHVSHYSEKTPLLINSLSLIQHKDGFGKNVVNLANYSFKETDLENNI